ncbi:MAG: DEAD/DEAH box helicase, partial [Cytophagaceae bacterium]
LALFTRNFNDFQSIRPVAVPDGLQASLRDYQKEGLNWLNFLDEFELGGCLADDMGLGKTIQIIAFILLQRTKNRPDTNLIVVPTSLLFNWQAEVDRFAPDLRILTFYGADRGLKKKSFDQYEIILTSYGTLLSEIRFLKEYSFNYIFLDESQAIKNPESQRYQAARLLQSRNRIVLTGTPIENHTFDLYGQLSFACPGLLGSYNHFKAHYSTPIDKFDDRQRARELQAKIKPFILRRTKAQVATELPDKTEMILHCEMGLEQRRVYDAYEQEFRNFLLTTKEGDIPRARLHVLQGLTKLRQICNSPILLNDEEFYGDSSAKIDMLLEQIENKSPNHKILVFSQFVSMLDLIRTELETRQISFEYLTGQTSNRAASVNRFQEDDTVRVFLISLKAGGTGLNLTQADYVYLVDPWWNPAVENQAIDRSYRIGQKKNVVAVRLICPNTIEEKILELQKAKRELADNLVKTDTATLKLLSKSDLLALLQ